MKTDCGRACCADKDQQSCRCQVTTVMTMTTMSVRGPPSPEGRQAMIHCLQALDSTARLSFQVIPSLQVSLMCIALLSAAVLLRLDYLQVWMVAWLALGSASRLVHVLSSHGYIYGCQGATRGNFPGKSSTYSLSVPVSHFPHVFSSCKTSTI